jgi:basic membrane lipoprotein Med (substrate-binding protein (PBP1-ABC) superfamily)/DNA-binding SARP family transcriptional activator
MEFRALGPLEVRSGGVPVELGAPMQRALLALLLIHANDVVPTERVIDALWPSDARDRRNALWVQISRLRTTLEPGRVGRGTSKVLLRKVDGYLLVVDPDSYDVARFERLAAEGRAALASAPARAAALLGDALAQWRGPAFDEFRYADFAQAEIARLDDERVTALEDRIDGDLAVGRTAALVTELEALRREHPLRERPVGQLMLVLYRSGRAADALREFARFRRTIGEELGIAPSPALCRLEEQVLLHDERLRRGSATNGPLDLRTEPVDLRAEPVDLRTEPANPFKGLRPFSEDDVDDFFGRDALTAETLRRLASGRRLVTIVGASGSGKSSVVRAGLIPALRKGGIPGSDSWVVARMVPGAHPFAELEAALLRAVFDPPPGLDEQLRDDDAGLLRATLRVLPDDAAGLLLVIDQFEELYTLCDDEDVRDRFLSNLVLAVDEPHGRLVVVLTLRADFYGQVLQHPGLGTRVGSGVVNVTPFTTEELEAAALGPARRVGVTFEPALLGRLLSDVGSQPGALPLFQYALTELFDRRAGATLLASAYRTMGGVQGALSRSAADLYTSLTHEQQRAARQLFLRLVTVTEAGEHIRRRVAASEILSLDVDAVRMQSVIGAFGRHRLLSFDADPLTGAPTVEVAHEALLEAWLQLRDWIEAARDGLRRHAAFTVALREWERAGEDAGYLLSGTRLAEYEQWAEDGPLTLTAAERAFLRASVLRRDQEKQAEATRRQQEAALRARARRRLWGLLAAIVAMVSGALVIVSGLLADRTGTTVAFFGFRGDNAFDANVAAGLDRAARDLDIELQETVPVVDVDRELRELAATGPDMIVSSAFTMFLAPGVIADYPEVQFGLIDGSVEAPNSAGVTFASEEGAFLVGAAAALKSETGVVGYLGGLRTDALEQFRAGYEAGAKHIDPDVEVIAAYIEEPFAGAIGYFLGPFNRPDLGRRRATTLFERADVVFQVAGESGFGVFDAAVEQSEQQGRHLWAIGVDNDQWLQASTTQRGHLLTSMIKRADLAAYLLTRDFLDGSLSAGVRELDLADDAMDFSTRGDGLTDAMAERLEQLKADIVRGRITVPREPSGELLVLDPLPRGFEEAFADLSHEQTLDYFDRWLLPTYSAAVEAECLSGTMRRCGTLMLDHLDEWRASDAARAGP